MLADQIPNPSLRLLIRVQMLISRANVAGRDCVKVTKGGFYQRQIDVFYVKVVHCE